MTVLEQVELAAHRAGDKLGGGWGMQLFGAFAAELAKITQQEREEELSHQFLRTDNRVQLRDREEVVPF